MTAFCILLSLFPPTSTRINGKIGLKTVEILRRNNLIDVNVSNAQLTFLLFENVANIRI